MVLYVILNNNEEKKYLECVVADSNKDVTQYCNNKYGKEYELVPIFYGSESNLSHIKKNEGLNDIKTEKEIYDKIETMEKTSKIYHKAFKESRIDRQTLRTQIANCNTTIDTLRWVLEKNGRHD